MTSLRQASHRLFLLLGIVFALAGSAHAKTLMWLTDWYQIGNVDTITQVLSVKIPHYSDTGSGSGYYYSTTDLSLTQTNAYAAPIPVHTDYRNDTLPDSLKIPTELYRNWYAVPNFSTANFQSGRIRVYIDYTGLYHRPLLTSNPPRIQVDKYPTSGTYAEGQTDQLEPSYTNGCIDTTKGDTVWFWTGALAASQINSSASVSSLKCLDHNPFFTYVGTAHVFNPWTGKTPYLQMGGVFYPTYADSGRPGWYSTRLYTDPRNPVPFKLRVASGNSSAANFLDAGGLNSDASGVPFDFTTTPGQGGEVWITPPLVQSKSIITTTAPAVKLQLYIEDPAWSSTTLRTVWQGSATMFVPSGTKYGNTNCTVNWFLETFYEGAVPSAIVLHQPQADTVYGAKGIEVAPTSYGAYANWINLSGISGGVASLSTEGSKYSLTAGLPAGTGDCSTKYLAFSAYDFRGKLNGTVPKTDPYFYEPFSQLGPKDNCPESGNTATKGLVLASLGANGLPVMNGSHVSTCGINTADSTDGPQFWFDTLWRNTAGVATRTYSAGATQLNAFHCYHMPLTLNASGTYYTYDNQSFWPLDTATTIPVRYRSFDTSQYGQESHDAKFALHARAAFEYTPGLQFSFSGDDDVWVFINKKLALDLGGQHGPQSGTIKLDNLGLVVGKSYQFDMFTAEREGDGSTISIKTTMNLVPTIDVSFDSSSTGTGKDVVVWTTETTTRTDICPEEGTATTSSKRLGNATFTLFFPDGTSSILDSTSSTSYPGITISGAGSHIVVDTVNLKKSGKLTESGLYQIWMDVGNESDSIIAFTVASQNVDVNGVLYDRNGDGKADSVVLHVVGASSSFKNIASAVLRWADSSGAADSVIVSGASFTVLAGDSVATAKFTPLPLRTSCPSGGCTGSMGIVYTVHGGDTLLNKIKVLSDGIAPVADSAWMVYDSTGSAWDTLYVVPSEPVSVSGGTPLAAVAAWMLAGQTSSPRLVTRIGTISNSGLLIKIAFDPSSDPIVATDSIRLGGKLSDALGNAPGDSSRWVPLHSNSVAKSWMLDKDGDGAPDSIGVSAKGDFSAATKVVVNWKTAGGADTSFSVSVSGLGTGFSLPKGILANATYCSGCGIEVDAGTTLIKKFSLLDSVQPAAVSASYRFGTTVDTLIVTASEKVVAGSADGSGLVGQKSAGNASTLGTLVTGTVSGTTTTILTLLVTPGTFTADSVRLRESALDVFGNAPKTVSPWVPVKYGPQNIRVVVRDANGDGLADSVQFILTRSATGAPVPTRFGLQWGGQTISIASLAISSDSLSWSGKVTPFALGTAPSSGDAGWIVAGTDSTSYKGGVEDSVAPVAISAKLVYGFESGSPDTLIVTASELLAYSGTNYVRLNADSSNTGASAPAASDILSSPTSGTTTLKLIVTSGSIGDNAAWVRLGTSVSDAGGAKVGTSSRWVKLVITPSGRAYLFDSNGDGRADSASIVVHGALSATSAKLAWTTAAGSTDTRTWPVASTSSSFGLHPSDAALWFEKGATSCPSGNCTISFIDSTGTTVATWTLTDSVAPMAISGTYSFGSIKDTLRVTFSEALSAVSDASSWVEWGNIGSTSSGAVTHAAATLNAGGTVATLVLDTANGATAQWDSVRIAVGTLSGKITDSKGVKAGRASPWAPLSYGLPPLTVAVSDPNGLGRGTNVSVHLVRAVPQQAIDSIDGVHVTWNGENRDIPLSDLTWNAGALSWSGGLSSPFALGATAYGAVHGAQASSKGGSTRALTLLDSVPPSIVRARYRFSPSDIALDTLIADLSEPWEGEAYGNVSDPFVTTGKTSKQISVFPMTGWVLSSDGTTLQIILDTAWEASISVGDSARLTHLDAGSRIWDAAGNRVGNPSRWVPIEFGLRPAQFNMKQLNPVLSNKGDNSWSEPAKDVPSVELLVKVDGTGNWVRVDENIQIGASGAVEGGTAAKNDASHVMGIDVKLNRPLVGTLFLYDNIGTSVTKVDLSPLAALWTGEEDAMREVRITWNGTGPNHKFVGTGVYLLRIVVKVSNGEGTGVSFENLVWKYGWQRGTK